MRRAAIQAFRTARRFPFRKLLAECGLPSSFSRHAVGLRSTSSSGRREDHGLSPTAASFMHYRNFSIALVSAVVASGAWYAYRDNSSTAGVVQGTNQSSHQAVPSNSLGPSRPLHEPSTASGRVYKDFESSEDNIKEEATRRALVVENDQFYTGTIDGDEPLHKSTDDEGRKVLEMMTPEQATQKLRRNEESYLVGRGRGVVRYDIVQVPSNDPIEDDHAEKVVEVPSVPVAGDNDGGSSNRDWMFWGVYDGHSGWTTSAKLRQVLISFVARELNATYKSALSNSSLMSPSPESIDEAIKRGFVRLDNEIIHESVEKVIKANSKRVAAELLAPALSGSCALLSFYDSQSETLRVACTGDSRAVLGRRGPHGKWTATPLSVDQTGSNEEEATRLRQEHPGEQHVVYNGRVLGGLEPTRAFGDSFYKWTKQTQDRIKGSFFGRTPSKLLQTPPYVTAEPVITTTKMDPKNGDFVVMATDGLWEMLTNEEVVGLVGQWLDAQQAGTTSGSSSSTSNKSWLDSWSWLGQRKQKGSLPVEKNDNDVQKNGQKTPIRQQQWWGVDVDFNGKENDRFVVEDKNAATHLVRNALGGKDRDMVCALLTLPSPYSRRYRDDLTVEVIFFGEGDDNTGDVVVNPDASALTSQLRARL
ncbi:MAG: hypothetical protein M1816_007985 [Peltula sp. TS41687]|nr:MAG: hypothetical protein M1816_007985 [Peltula sp. TS41687]